MSNISSDETDLNQLHRTIIMSIGEMFSRPIRDKVLNRSTLIKGLSNMRKHEEIKNYFYFTELVLDNLNLEHIDIIGDYIFLKKLILRENCIKDLSVLNSLNDLEYLDVSHNCLERILHFNPPRMLNYVDISNNNIERLEDLSNFWSLAHLDLSHNRIKNVIGLQELKFLIYLNLSHNCIKQILSNSLPYTLVEIDLSYNDIEHIQWDMSSSLCEILNVSHNKLKLLHFLNNAKHLSVLHIQNNMIDDVLQIEYLKSLTNLRVLNVENNKFVDVNVHKQIFSNNLPSKSIIDQTFIKTGLLQELNQMEVYSLLMAKKNTSKLTVLEYLSGKSPIGGAGSGRNCNETYSLPMVILVGPPKTRKKYLLNRILTKQADKFYRAFIYTTNDTCKNSVFKTITVQVFDKMTCSGEFVFSYRFLGHLYGLSKDQLIKCANERKVLITFTNLEGALSLKLKGYNPIFVMVLPVDKSLYKQNVYQSIEKYMNRNSPTEKETRKETAEQTLNAIDNNSSTNPNDFTLKSFAVCSSDTVVETKIISENKNDIDDDLDDSILNDPRVVYTNECINNLDIYFNLFEKSTGIFHSLVYVDNSQSALKEIMTVMVDVYNKYQTNKKSETQEQPNKHTLEYIQARHKQLSNELFR